MCSARYGKRESYGQTEDGGSLVCSRNSCTCRSASGKDTTFPAVQFSSQVGSHHSRSWWSPSFIGWRIPGPSKLPSPAASGSTPASRLLTPKVLLLCVYPHEIRSPECALAFHTYKPLSEQPREPACYCSELTMSTMRTTLLCAQPLGLDILLPEYPGHLLLPPSLLLASQLSLFQCTELHSGHHLGSCGLRGIHARPQRRHPGPSRLSSETTDQSYNHDHIAVDCCSSVDQDDLTSHCRLDYRPILRPQRRPARPIVRTHI